MRGLRQCWCGVWMRCSCGAGHVDGTRGSGIVSSAADVQWMSVVCGI